MIFFKIKIEQEVTLELHKTRSGSDAQTCVFLYFSPQAVLFLSINKMKIETEIEIEIDQFPPQGKKRKAGKS